MYSNLSNLRQHMRLIHNPQSVTCPLCNKPFKTELYLKRHLVSFHELSIADRHRQEEIYQQQPKAQKQTGAQTHLQIQAQPTDAVKSFSAPRVSMEESTATVTLENKSRAFQDGAYEVNQTNAETKHFQSNMMQFDAAYH
ncbi:hypothetical protein ANTRET_LOCUS647 [Anthophora retusa]